MDTYNCLRRGMLQCSTAWYGIRSCDNSVARTHLKHFKALQNDCCKQVEHENAVEHDKQTEESTNPAQSSFVITLTRQSKALLNVSKFACAVRYVLHKFRCQHGHHGEPHRHTVHAEMAGAVLVLGSRMGGINPSAMLQK
jgi:hypothetical protein